MEQILNKLSEIEATANAIMQDAARQKQALSEEAEKQIKDFDASLETKTSAEIQKIREDLAREKDARITQLRTETEGDLTRKLYTMKFQQISGILKPSMNRK